VPVDMTGTNPQARYRKVAGNIKNGDCMKHQTEKIRALKTYFNALCLTLFLIAGASDVMAERLETASISESPWTFTAYIDGWLPKAPATIVIDGNPVFVPEDLNVILDSLKLTMMLRTTTRKGPLGIFFNPLYYKGTFDNIVVQTPVGELGGTINENVWLVDYGVSYEVARWDIGKNGNSRLLTFEPYVGFRYFYDNFTLTLEDDTIDFSKITRKHLRSNSPMIGFQSSLQLNDNWDFRFIGDYGGFDVNNMDNSYLMSGYFNYAFKMKNHDATAYLGYRFYHLGLEDNTQDTSISVNIQGPLFGFGFTF
jgi:hypothetical protein